MTSYTSTTKSPQNTAKVYCAEKWAIVTGRIKLTAKIEPRIIDEYYRPQTMAYLTRKYGWCIDTLTIIHWEAIHQAQYKQQMQVWVSNSKTIYGWLPTTAKAAMYDKSKSPYAPSAKPSRKHRTAFIGAPTWQPHYFETLLGYNLPKDVPKGKHAAICYIP
jgi:hypothetical protein